MQPRLTDGGQTHMEKYVAVKHQNVVAVGKFRPIKLVRAETCVFCAADEKISLVRNFSAINSDCPLDGMAHDSPFLHFLVIGPKNMFGA